MALAEGHIVRNPASLLFTPREASRSERRVMGVEDVKKCFGVLGQRERLIVKLAILAGMRPGEIFALTWGRLTATSVDIRQRIYRGMIDTPKSSLSVRQAALPEGLLREIEAWRGISLVTDDDAWVFPSEKLSTPMSKDNCWNRSIKPKLAKAGLAWANFQVMRRTHSTLDLNCLVPQCDGVKYEQLPSWEALWDKYFTGAPARQRQCVEQYKIVKRA